MNYKFLNIKNKFNLFDSFYLKKKILRTHLTSFQNRYLKNFINKIKIFNIGKCYRKDFDKTHLPVFFQLDFFILNKKNYLKNNLLFLLKFISFCLKKKFFFKIRKVHFSFTIISFEIDIFYNNWIELLGFGLVNKNLLLSHKVFLNAIAGGIGINRIFMIKKKIYNIFLNE